MTNARSCFTPPKVSEIPWFVTSAESSPFWANVDPLVHARQTAVLAAKMLSAHQATAPVFKIAFEEHGKKVSDLMSNDEEPKK